MARLNRKLLESDFWHTESEKLPDIYETRRQLAKVTNQRLRRLETSLSPISGEPYTYGAYDIIDEYIKENAKGRRISESLGLNRDRNEIIREIDAMQKFLLSKSSTVAGQRKAEEKRVSSFIEKGIPEDIAKSKEFYDFLASSSYETLVGRPTEGKAGAFTSEQIIDQIERASKDGVPIDELVQAFGEFTEKTGQKSFKDLVAVTDAVILKNSGNK